MKKTTIILMSLIVLIMVMTQSTAQMEGKMELIFGEKIETTVNEADITEPVVYNHTCEKGASLSKGKDGKDIGQCYGEKYLNTTSGEYNTPLMFSHEMDYSDGNTIYWTVNEKKGTYKEYINKTVAVKKGIRVSNSYMAKDIIFEDCDVMCREEGNIVTCDSTIDGNGDGILQSGESGFTINLNYVDLSKAYIRSDSAWYSKLKGCLRNE